MAGYVGHTPAQEREMLRAIGVSSFDDLLRGVPESARMKGRVPIPAGQSEEELRRLFRGLADLNYDPGRTVSFLGAGLYDHILPAAIRQMTLRSEFYTAYTPYQAEVAQGTLATIFEFQSLVAELTGMDVANASMYDGASAAAEALLLAAGATGRSRILICEGLHPHALQVVETYTDGPALERELIPLRDGLTDLDALQAALDDRVAAVLVQYPNFFGCVEALGPLSDRVHAAGAMLVVSANLVSLGLLEPPGAFGADLVVGEAQSFGNPHHFGGPLCGVFAARKDLVRRLPGRLVAETQDAGGHRGFVLTLQTREQHIRRGQATSNICTNNNLVALGVTLYFTLLGRSGLMEVARQSLLKAHYLEGQLTRIPGVRRVHGTPFFHEFTLELPKPAGAVLDAMLTEYGILAGLDLDRIPPTGTITFREHTPRGTLAPRRTSWVPPAWNRRLLVAVTEKRTRKELDQYAEALAEILSRKDDTGLRETGGRP